METIQNFIAGKRISAANAQCHPVYNPAQGEICAQVAFANADEVNHAVAVAKAAFPAWAATTPLRRARVIFKFKELLEQHIEELAAIVTREHGKVLADAKGSVMRGIELAEFYCGIPHLLTGTYSENVGTGGIDSYTMRQPLGVCVGITPFNFPVMVPVWMLVPAIACGNTFVLKPSEKDPSATLLLAELMQKAGLPDGVLNVVHGAQPVVDQLITHPDVVAVSCVGSSAVAEHIYQTAIQHGKRAQTFGGAKNHAIVMPDADLEDAAAAIVGAAYGAAGERCMALSVAVTVGDKTADRLVELMQPQIKILKIGPGTEPNVDMGPLVTREHWQRVWDYVELGVKEGARLVYDGRDVKISGAAQGFFMGPCLFDHVTTKMRIYQEEIFGPVLCVVRASDYETALQMINAHVYGNGTAIFTRDGEVAHHFAAHVQVGMVGVNVPIPVPVAYHIFGGWKRSVFGDTALHGMEGVHFYTKAKTITSRWPTAARSNPFHMPTN